MLFLRPRLDRPGRLYLLSNTSRALISPPLQHKHALRLFGPHARSAQFTPVNILVLDNFRANFTAPFILRRPGVPAPQNPAVCRWRVCSFARSSFHGVGCYPGLQLEGCGRQYVDRSINHHFHARTFMYYRKLWLVFLQ